MDVSLRRNEDFHFWPCQNRVGATRLRKTERSGGCAPDKTRRHSVGTICVCEIPKNKKARAEDSKVGRDMGFRPNFTYGPKM